MSDRGRHSRRVARPAAPAPPARSAARAAPAAPAPPEVVARPAPTAADWGVVAALCVCAVVLSVLELLFVPFYVGRLIFPIAVPVAIAGNIALPRLGIGLLGRAAGGVLPFLAWLIPLLVLALTPRAEGDVIVLAVTAQEWTFYGVLILGCVAGMVTISRSSPRRVPAVRPDRRSLSR
jgi:hypothetical protein